MYSSNVKEKYIISALMIGFLVWIFWPVESCLPECRPDCSPDCPAPQVKTINNYIVLLDLSDRIVEDGQIDRDTTIIGNLYDIFLDRVKSELYINSKDKFRIVIANQKNQFPNQQIFDIEDALYVDMDNIKLSKKKDIRDSKETFMFNIAQLYKLAKFSDNKNDYKGANIFGYLKNRLTNDRLDIDGAKNYLLIITDGYQYVQGKQYKPIDIWQEVADLGNFNIGVVEINPIEKKGDEELDRIKDAWRNWLDKMNAKNVLMLDRQQKKNIKNKLSKFILKKN